MFKTKELQSKLQEVSTLKSVEAEEVILSPGQYIKYIPIVVKGSIRVLRQTDEGDETYLYHVLPGETCAFSLTCCSALKPSEVKTIAEEYTEFYAIPVQYMEEWQQFQEWREFIGNTYQTRFNKLLQVIDDIAFKQMDERLWSYLKSRAEAQKTNILHLSHDEIAQELNIQRESATRLIKKLKELKRLETSRNLIKII